MNSTLEVYFLPELTTAENLAGKTVVVIDVLRATTTIAHALAAGARQVFVCETVDEARELAATLPGSLLGGERGGVRIEGFDLGNSPTEYAPEVVRGKTVIFTTTNGTRAMRVAGQARQLLLGAFVNFSAVCDALRREPAISGAIVLLCAGTDRQVTREDVLFAGAVTDELCRAGGFRINDQAAIAADAWRVAARDLRGAAPLAETLRETRGGQNLIDLGLERDIAIAADIDRLTHVPRVDTANWSVL
jgi:2-phosphosulfolactate phosphatase